MVGIAFDSWSLALNEIVELQSIADADRNHLAERQILLLSRPCWR
jgi:hypothetical protein